MSAVAIQLIPPTVIEVGVTTGTATVVPMATPAPVVELLFGGPPGPPGGAASISADAENRLTNGSDGRLFVPELTVDPVAYYILAKA